MDNVLHAPITVGLADADRLPGLSRRSIEYLCYGAAPRLPSRKVGKRRLILYADLRRFLSGDRPGDIAPESGMAQ